MDFAKAIEKEKKRLENKVVELNKQKSDIDSQIKETLLELDAVRAYFSTRDGKPPSKKRGASVRAQILALIKSQPMTRADVITALGYQDKKGKQQTVSNTLSALKKKGDVTLKDGTYSAK